jgi:hypothetical protein
MICTLLFSVPSSTCQDIALKQAMTSSSYIHPSYIDPTNFHLLLLQMKDHKKTQEKEVAILAFSSPSIQHITRVVGIQIPYMQDS